MVLLQFLSEALLFRFLRGSFLGLIHRELTTLAVGLSRAEHVPNDSRQLSHHGNTSDRCSSSAFDPFEPLTQRLVLFQSLVRHLCQQPSSHAAAGFGDAAQTFVVVTAVAAAGCESPKIGQAMKRGNRSTRPMRQANAMAVKRPTPGIDVSRTASLLEAHRSSITFSSSLTRCWMCSKSASK